MTTQKKQKGKLVPKLRFKGFDGEWEKKMIGSIAELTSSKRVYLSDYVNIGIPFYRGKEISELKKNIIPNDILYISESSYLDFKEKYGVPQKDDILITAVGTLGNVLRIQNEDKFYFKDGNLIWFRKISESSEFLELILEVKKLDIEKTSIGSTQRALTMVELRKLIFAFPTLPEQQKISSFLSSVDEKLSQLTRKKELLAQYKKGVMQQLFSGKLRFKDENGKEFKKWEEKRLGEVTYEIKRDLKDKTDLSEMEVLTISSEKGFISQQERFSQVIAGQSLSKYTLLKSGEMSYNRGASKRFKYGCFYVLSNYDCALVPNVYISFGFQESSDSSYFNYLFSTGFANNQLKKYISSSVRLDGLLNINRGDFFSIKLPVPSLKEQQKIATFLSSIDDKITAITAQISQTQSFKKGLLQQMFV